jgi:predicted nucleic acid-binding protein
LIDTSVVIGFKHLDLSDLPQQAAVSAITLAELAAGPVAAADPNERARRQVDLQYAEAAFTALPFDEGAARAYGQVYAAVVAAGRKARGRRALDLLIAATALAHGLPLYTRNPEDFSELTELIEVVGVSAE